MTRREIQAERLMHQYEKAVQAYTDAIGHRPTGRLAIRVRALRRKLVKEMAR